MLEPQVEKAASSSHVKTVKAESPGVSVSLGVADRA